MRLLLARHGEIDGNGERYIGATDPPISVRGQVQASALAETVLSFRPDCCFCSPMLRTRQTAEIVLRPEACGINYLPELREVDFGLWEGLSFDEIQARYPELAADWANKGVDFGFPEGEKIKDFWNRVRAAARLFTSGPEETVLIISHGGVIRALICHFLGLEFDNYLLFNVRPGGLVTLEVSGQSGVLTGFNL